MRLLVLGGTSFVGRTVVTEAVRRGWSVTTFNRGLGGWRHPEAEHIRGDRTVGKDLDQLRAHRWDAAVDTWAGAPRVVQNSVEVLSQRVAHYSYISSRAVYAQPVPKDVDETAPTVSGAADAFAESYSKDKRGGELAVEAAFAGRSVLARAGLILGPHEDVGRLPFWLLRVAAGGPILMPGPPDLPWRFIDVRDLAGWLLHAIDDAMSGPFNLVAPLGHATTGSVVEEASTVTGGTPELTWVDHEQLETAGISRWDAFPGWVPPGPELAGLIWTDVTRAVNAGLACRSSRQTVADTWAWVLERGGAAPLHPDHPHGLDRELELQTIEDRRRRG